MRPRPSRFASLLVTSAVLTGFLAPTAAARPYDGPHAGGDAGPAAGDGGAPAAVDVRELPEEPPSRPEPPRNARGGDLFGADCDTEVTGSRVTAYCHNRYPRTDLVRLHVECERWWDVDSDSVAVAVAPADHVQLTSRCWKEIRSAWVSHQRG
ncbi:hypothetical protein ACIQUQ_34900 [Streptomyces sp. NPDC101118]|uniref:hypothetical protein n=1 Tax=Streptomyces sp. NPDC101118 TaxID=3366109 RepID=UPI00382FB6FC